MSFVIKPRGRKTPKNEHVPTLSLATAEHHERRVHWHRREGAKCEKKKLLQAAKCAFHAPEDVVGRAKSVLAQNGEEWM